MAPLTDEQIAQRRLGIGSSDIGAIVGENPYRNAHDVWLEKTGLAQTLYEMGAAAPFEGNDATWLGNELEPIIARRYTLETGERLIPGPGTVAHPEHPWALATTDYEHPGGAVAVECKYVGQRAAIHWSAREEDGVAPYYLPQVQWQMLVRNMGIVRVAVLFGGTAEFRIYEVKRSEPLIGALVKIGGRFWRENVLERVPPPIDASDAARKALLALYPSSRAPLKEAPPEAAEWFARRAMAKDSLDAAKGDFDLASNKLVEIIGDAEGIKGDFGVVTFKSDVRGRRSLRVYPRKECAA